MYTITLNAECQQILNKIKDQAVGIPSILTIIEEFKTQSTGDLSEALAIIDQQLKAVADLSKQVNDKDIAKLRFCLESQKRNLLMEKIGKCYVNVDEGGGYIAVMQERKAVLQAMVNKCAENADFLTGVKDLYVGLGNSKKNQEDFLKFLPEIYYSAYKKRVSAESALWTIKDIIGNFDDSRIFDDFRYFDAPTTILLTQKINDQTEEKLSYQAKIKDIERFTALEPIIFQACVCNSLPNLRSLCQERKSIDDCIAGYSAIAAGVPEEKEYVSAVEYIKKQLLSAKSTREDIVKNYIDSQLNTGKLSESIDRYGYALEIAIGSLTVGDPLREDLETKQGILTRLKDHSSFVSMCSGIDELAKHGDEMVSRFFTTGTPAAKRICAELSLKLRTKVIDCLLGPVEVDLAREITALVQPFVAQMKNRNVFTKVAKFFAGIFEFIGPCIKHKLDFFKPKCKELAEAIITHATPGL